MKISELQTYIENVKNKAGDIDVTIHVSFADEYLTDIKICHLVSDKQKDKLMITTVASLRKVAKLN